MESTGTAIGNPETTRTTTKDTNAVITITILVTFLFKPFIAKDVLDASFKIQLERYRY